MIENNLVAFRLWIVVFFFPKCYHEKLVNSMNGVHLHLGYLWIFVECFLYIYEYK